MKIKNRKQSAFIAFTSLLVIGAVTLSIAISVSLIAVGGLKNSLTFKKGEATKQFAYSCLEEALIRLKDDSNYSSATLNLNDFSCTIMVSGSGANRNIVVVADSIGPPKYTRKLSASIKRLGNSINLLSITEP